MTEARNIIPAGPGFIGLPDGPHDYSADVELEIEYINLDPSDTRASITLRATNVEPPFAAVAVGVELTKADLIWLHNTADAMIVAAIADEPEDE